VLQCCVCVCVCVVGGEWRARFAVVTVRCCGCGSTACDVACAPFHRLGGGTRWSCRVGEVHDCDDRWTLLVAVMQTVCCFKTLVWGGKVGCLTCVSEFTPDVGRWASCIRLYRCKCKCFVPGCQLRLLVVWGWFLTQQHLQHHQSHRPHHHHRSTADLHHSHGLCNQGVMHYCYAPVCGGGGK
jgi:hypothetical protein